MSSFITNLAFAVGIVGNIVSLTAFAAPIKTFRRVVKKKSTENYEGAPYITTFLCTSLWTFYGVLKPGGFFIATVNGAGALFQCIYILLFLIYAPQDKKVKTAKLVVILDVGFLGAAISVTLFALRGSLQLTFLGILCTVLTIIMYASPLLTMKTVIKTKSVEYMPFLLSFFLFVNAGIWAMYSVLVKDFYIGIPNTIGLVLGLTQLIIYAIYKRKSITEKGPVGLAKEGEDEEANLKAVKALKKVKSLPKPSMGRQETIRSLLKTLSFGAYSLPSSCSNQDHDDADVEMGAVAETFTKMVS